MDKEALRRKAEHHRQLALLVSDDQMAQELEKLAALYDAMAIELAIGTTDPAEENRTPHKLPIK